jgi:hypothetical protein
MPRVAFINLEAINTLAPPSDASTTTTPATTTIPRDESLHLEQQLTNAYAINIPDAYRRLHAVREDGTIHTSVHALCEIWQRLPYWRALAHVVRNTPGVLPLAGVIYEFFAAKRIKWRQGLSSGSACSISV